MKVIGGFILNIIINILVIIIGIFSVQSFWLIVKYFVFEIPYSNHLLSIGAIDNKSRIQMNIEKGISVFFVFALSNAMCLLGAFLTKPSGFTCYFVTVGIMLLFFRPEKEVYTWSHSNILKFLSRHSVCIDFDKIKKHSENKNDFSNVLADRE